MKRIVIVFLTLSTLPACSSHKVKPVDEPLEVKGKLGNQEIGLNEAQEGIIQESVAVEDELRTQRWRNYESERRLKQARVELAQCRTELADPRLGGTRKLDPIPELELSEDLGKIQERIGITRSGRIQVVKKQFLNERVEKERQYQESLSRLLQVIEGHREECSRELGYNRVAHGLPSERYRALGYYGPEGNFIVTRPAERNLDDAFRILAEQTREGKRLEQKESGISAETSVSEEL